MGLLEVLQGGASGVRAYESVTRHIQHLLSSTRRFGAVHPEYGVTADALLGGTMTESEERLPVERLRLEILRVVQQFEPAIASPVVDVRFRDSQGNLHFQLSGDLRDGSGAGTWYVSFSTWSRIIHVEEAP